MEQMTRIQYALAIRDKFGGTTKCHWFEVDELISLYNKIDDLQSEIDLLKSQITQLEMERDGYETPMQIRASLGI